MPATLEPPIASPPSPTPKPVPAPKPAPAPSPAQPKPAKIDPPDLNPLPAAEAPKLKPWERMDAELGKLAGKEDERPPIEQKAPEPKPDDDEGTPEPEAKAEEPKPEQTEIEKRIANEKRDRKIKAWPLVEEYRKLALKLEQENIELKNRTPSEPPDLKPLNENLTRTTEKLTAAEQRLKEVEEELKYTAYERSGEFKEQYVKPYEDAWARAIRDLKGLQVTLADGQTREIAWQDVQALANMEPDVRRKTIKEQFPDDVQEVTGHVKSIRELADKQREALDTFRKSGDERARAKVEASQKQLQQMSTQVVQAWTTANQEAPKHEKYGKYFAEVEGDEEGNSLLKKGFEKADAAFSANPLDPNLTPDQRAEIVRRQAAQRNRSAAFSRLVHMVEKREARIAELEAKLKEFEASEPGQGNGKPAVEQQAVKPMDRLLSGLDSFARPTI
jgi:hypothetical protein